MNYGNYRKSIHYYALSMSFFKKLHDKGDISDGLYEYIEIRLVLKYGILPKSVLRDSFKLKWHSSKLIFFINRLLYCKYMLIASIAILSLLVLGFIAIIILTRYPKAADFEIKTRTSNLIIGLVYFFFFIFGIGLSVVSLVVILSTGEKSNNLVFVIVGGGFGLFALLFVLLVHSQFEAIKGNKVYVRRFIKIREYDIKNIRTIDFVMNRTYSITGVPAFGFNIDKNTVGVEQFITLLKERTDKLLSEQTSEEKEVDGTQIDNQDRESDILTKIGKEFRENYPKYRKNQLTGTLIIFAVFFFGLLGGSLAGYFSAKNVRWLIITFLCIPLFFIFLAVFLTIRKNFGKELKQDDKQLGYRHKFDNKNVKGAAKHSFIVSIIFVCIFGIGSLLIDLMMGIPSLSSSPVKQENLVMVSGEFEYMRRIPDRYDDDYAIGLKNDSTEYRISSMDYEFFDKNFKNEVVTGTIISVYIDSNRDPISINYEGRTSWTYAYIVKTDSKEYLSYDSYLKAFNDNKQIGVNGFIICMSISGASVVGLGASYIVYKVRSKKETIEI